MKNRFSSPKFIEEEILDEKGNKVGTVRIKPSGVLWKEAGKQDFYSVDLEKFKTWITDPATKAKKVQK